MSRMVRIIRHAKPEEMDLTPKGLNPNLCQEGIKQAERLALEPELVGLTVYTSPLIIERRCPRNQVLMGRD